MSLAWTAVPLPSQQFVPAGKKHLEIAADPHEFIVADMDQDGDRDLIEVASGRLLLNDGVARFREATGVSLPIRGSAASTGVAADFDANGTVDLLIFDPLPTLLLQAVGLQFFNATAGRIPSLGGALLGATYVEAEAADLDADGDVDVVLDYGAVGPPQVLLNDGSANFTPMTLRATLTTFFDVHDLIVADLNRDGAVDVLRSSGFASSPLATDGGTVVFYNDGAGNLTNAQLLAQDPRRIAVGDLSGDGFADVATFTFGPAGFGRVFVDGGGSGGLVPAAPQFWPAAPGAKGQAIAIVDADSDGFMDVVLGGEMVFFNRRGIGPIGPMGLTVGSTWAMPGNPIYEGRGAVEDFDGDGRDDILYSDGSLLLGDGEGAFELASDPPTATDVLWIESIADVDGDGDLDGLYGDGLVWRRGDDRWQLDRSLVPVTQGVLYGVLGYADLDGDGDPDFVSGVDRPQLFINDGSGAFVDEALWRLPSGPWGGWSVGTSLEDLDGDGLADLLVQDAARTFVLQNDGSGRFSVVYTAAIRDVRTVDVDGDGDRDLIRPQVLLVNNGAGSFQQEWNLRMPVSGVPSGGLLLAADFTGDGAEDMLWGERGIARLLVNDGTGRFAFTGGSIAVSTPVQASDVDGDGDLDVTGPGGRFARNDGAGCFTPEVLRRWSGSHFGTFFDFDSDGDSDFFYFGRTIENRCRQLSTPFVAQRSRPFEVVVHAECGADGERIAAAFIGLSQRFTPLGELGLLAIDPVTAVPIGNASLPTGVTNTMFSFTIASTLPAHLEFFVQGIVLDRATGVARLTNARRERLR